MPSDVVQKRIFGRSYRFETDALHAPLVDASVGLYPDAGEGEPAVRVRFAQGNLPGTVIARNPSLHELRDEGVAMTFGRARVLWSRGSSGTLDVHVTPAARRSLAGRAAAHLVSREFSSEVERFEQWLHELVLVPSTFFFDDVVPVHAACVATGEGACLIAGTGGVGKSSALLALRAHAGVTFVSDDFTVVGRDGAAFGNMAWPKIYGYNCIGNGLSRELLAGRGLIDKAHFHVRNRIDPSWVRRKVRPDRLFHAVEADRAPLARLLYLVREAVPDLRVEPLAVDRAVTMTIAVLRTELAAVGTQIAWAEYNAAATGRPPMLASDVLAGQWRDTLAQAFTGVERLKVSIPLAMDHPTYQARIQAIVTGGRA